jgi:hypothetical protein
MFASLQGLDRSAIQLARTWLEAHRSISASHLDAIDPERLVERSGDKGVVRTFRWKRAMAIWNGYQLLAKREAFGWAIEGENRETLKRVLIDLEGDSNCWFFAMANRRPDRGLVDGACLMLQVHALDSSCRFLEGAGLGELKARLRCNLPGWIELAREEYRPVLSELLHRLDSRFAREDTE